MIEITNKKVHNFIVEKDEMVNKGRAISLEMEKIDLKVKRFEDREKKITAKVVPPKELTDQGEDAVKQIEKFSLLIDKLSKEINDFKLKAIPEDMKTEHLKLLKDREVLERERNKVALKVQKIKDKIIPVIQKEVKPLLGEYDDIETAKTKDGKVVITTFNHLDDFKKKFRR